MVELFRGKLEESPIIGFQAYLFTELLEYHFTSKGYIIGHLYDDEAGTITVPIEKVAFRKN